MGPKPSRQPELLEHVSQSLQTTQALFLQPGLGLLFLPSSNLKKKYILHAGYLLQRSARAAGGEASPCHSTPLNQTACTTTVPVSIAQHGARLSHVPCLLATRLGLCTLERAGFSSCGSRRSPSESRATGSSGPSFQLHLCVAGEGCIWEQGSVPDSALCNAKMLPCHYSSPMRVLIAAFSLRRDYNKKEKEKKKNLKLNPC